MADHAVVCRRQSRTEVTPRAMPGYPVADVAPRCCLIMAANAEILTVADQAPFAVSFCHETVAERAPGIRMVARHTRIVTGNAVCLFVTGKAVIAQDSRTVYDGIHGPAVVFKPVALV